MEEVSHPTHKRAASATAAPDGRKDYVITHTYLTHRRALNSIKSTSLSGMATTKTVRDEMGVVAGCYEGELDGARR